MRVKDLMSQPLSTCHVHDSAACAAQIMWEHDCGIVPIVDDHGQLVGVVTDRDICMAAYFQNRPLTEVPIEHFMSRDLTACHPEDALSHAEQLMSDRQIHRVPVVDSGGAPIGILSLSDLAREVVRTSNGRHEGDPGEALLHTVAAISRPRWAAR